jgi:hypothetical protein
MLDIQERPPGASFLVLVGLPWQQVAMALPTIMKEQKFEPNPNRIVYPLIASDQV